jgi:hypothetical protein
MRKPPAEFSLQAAASSLRPPDIPVGVPADLLERRPDIAAAERRVAAASEQIGIARAALFPTVMLSAAAGFEGALFANWLNWRSRLWAIGPFSVQTLFDAGRRKATSEAAVAGFGAAAADYRESAWPHSSRWRTIWPHSVSSKPRPANSIAPWSPLRNRYSFSLHRYKGGVDTYLQVVTSQTAALTNGMRPISSGGAWMRLCCRSRRLAGLECFESAQTLKPSIVRAHRRLGPPGRRPSQLKFAWHFE